MKIIFSVLLPVLINFLVCAALYPFFGVYLIFAFINPLTWLLLILVNTVCVLILKSKISIGAYFVGLLILIVFLLGSLFLLNLQASPDSQSLSLLV